MLAQPVKSNAADLFELSASDNLGARAFESGNDLFKLFDRINGDGSSFDNFDRVTSTSISAALKYQGVDRAILFDIRRPGGSGTFTTARLTSPISGLDKTFQGPEDEVYDQIKDFFKKDGAKAYADFLRAISARSKVSPTDGNPGAATARSSFQNFTEYSSTMTETREEKELPKDLAGRAGFGMVADVGVFDANGIKGTAYSLPLFAKFRLSERVGLNFNIPLSYTEIEDAKVYGAGLAIGVPVKIILKKRGNPWFWQVTPFGGGNAVGSKEIVTGGLIVNGGIGSVVSYDFGNFELSMGNQFGQYESIALNFDGVKVDPGVAQKIVKNGLKVGIPFAKRWVFEAYAVHTKFLEAAGVDQYLTTGGEIGYRFLGKPDAAKKKNGYMKLGLYTDIGSGYFSPHIQFGSGWKF